MAAQGLRGVTVALIALLAVPPAFAQRPAGRDAPAAPESIAVEATPILAFDHRGSDRKRFGQLEFRGGLVLTSKHREFGGLSAFSLAPDGVSFIAATDRGWWLRGQITYSGTRPSGIGNAEIAPMLGPDGRTLRARGWWDAESIARDGGTLYVGIERVHRILQFDYGRDGLRARGRPIEVPAAFKAMPRNGGIEALVFVPRGGPLGGSLIAISESGRDDAGDHLAFLVRGARPGQFTIKRRDGYDVSDAVVLGPGELLILERRFGWTTGLYSRIRRLSLAEVRPGALVDGPVLFEADLGQQIDNMEGIAVHRSGNETVLTLISDNNFSPIQRNLLLQFTLVPPI